MHKSTVVTLAPHWLIYAQVAADHVTGDGKYTDKLRFMFENADGGDDCELSGCSVSQVARGVHENHALMTLTGLRPRRSRP